MTDHSDHAAWLKQSTSPAPLRDPVILREQVILQLRCIIDPDLHRDIVSLGFVKQLNIDYDQRRVAFKLELTTPACPIKEKFVEEATRLLKDLLWVDVVDIEVTSKNAGQASRASTMLENVKNIILVSSCKGGVGKSTIACNLAYMIDKLGGSVGLVDADVYGPNLPTLIPMLDQYVIVTTETQKSNAAGGNKLQYEDSGCCQKTRSADQKSRSETEFNAFVPLIHNGVKLMSYGYFKASKNYAAIRGPIASSLVTQMISNTFWGNLDYLIVDLPPGTSDIHLTVAQTFKIVGAVVVTTAQQLSLTDVEKGIDMFSDLKIPTLCVVENMAGLFGPYGTSEQPGSVDSWPQKWIQRLRAKTESEASFAIPFHPDLAQNRFHVNDTDSFPFVAAHDKDHPVWEAFRELAANLVRKVATLQHGPRLKNPVLKTLTDGRVQFAYEDSSDERNHEQTVELTSTCRKLRLNCRCAMCVDEITGISKLNPRKVSRRCGIREIKESGNYAFAVEWADGHYSIYPFTLLKKIFEDELLDMIQSANIDADSSESDGNDW